MSDDLDAVIREMWPGLQPGERYYLDGKRVFKASQLDDRRLQAVPDKERQMDDRPRPPAPGPAYVMRGQPVPQAVPDKEQSMDEQTQTEAPQHFAAIRPALDAYLEAAAEMPMPGMPLSDALATFAETVGDAGRINADVHGLPISFFGRGDVENVDVLVSQGRVLITGQLVIGGHRFLCFSEGFPMGAE